MPNYPVPRWRGGAQPKPDVPRLPVPANENRIGIIRVPPGGASVAQKGFFRIATKGIPLVGWALLAYDLYELYEWYQQQQNTVGYTKTVDCNMGFTHHRTGFSSGSSCTTYIRLKSLGHLPEGGPTSSPTYYQLYRFDGELTPGYYYYRLDEKWKKVGSHSNPAFQPTPYKPMLPYADPFADPWPAAAPAPGGLPVPGMPPAPRPLPDPYPEPWPEAEPARRPRTPRFPKPNPRFPVFQPGPNFPPDAVPDTAVGEIVEGAPAPEWEHYAPPTAADGSPAKPKPPGRRTKEKKLTIRTVGGAAFFLADAAFGVVEFMGLAHDALPKEYRCKGYCNPYDKAVAIWENFDKMDWKQFFENMMNDVIEDTIIGTLGQAAGKVNAATGLSTGAGRALRNPTQGEKYVDEEGNEQEIPNMPLPELDWDEVNGEWVIIW